MRTTTILFAAIGLLLVGVAVTRTPGQQVAGGQGACCLPSGGCTDTTQGLCEGNTFNGVWRGDLTTCISLPPCPSVEPPTVVGISAVFFDPNNSVQVYRAWSDGQVDLFVGTACNPATPCVIVPGSCPTDVNRDGDTGIQDFLTLLGGWAA